MWRRCPSGELDRLQIGRSRLAAAAVRFDVERELLSLIEVAHASALDGGDVNEHIRAARVLDDEAEALLGVEKLYGTLSHDGLHLKRITRFVAVQTIRTVFNPDFALLGKGPLSPHDFLGSCSQGETSRRLNREWRVYSDDWSVLQSVPAYLATATPIPRQCARRARHRRRALAGRPGRRDSRTRRRPAGRREIR